MTQPRRTAPASFLPLKAFRFYYAAFVLVFAQAIAAVDLSNEYATQFTLTCYDDFCDLNQNCVDPPISYKLHKKPLVEGANLYSEHPVFGTYRSDFNLPVTSFVSLDVTYLPPFDKLKVQDKLVGVLSHNHVSTPSIKALIDEGKIEEVGYIENSYYVVNTTLINELNPGVTFGSKYDVGFIGKIDSFMLNCETEESVPLGQVEWLKWFGILVEEETNALAEFELQKTNYFRLRDLALKAKKIPKVVAGFSYNNNGETSFSLPGGGSYVSNLIKDANAEYVGDTTKETGSLVVPLENFLEKAINVKYWIHADYMNVRYMDDILRNQPEVERLASVQCEYVVLRDNNKYDDGYIPFFETGTSNPYLVLQDLIHTLHPELLSSSFQPTFYRRALFNPQSSYKTQCPFADDEKGSESSDDGLSSNAIAGIVLGCLFILAVGMYAAYHLGQQKGHYQALQLLPTSVKSGGNTYSEFANEGL